MKEISPLSAGDATQVEEHDSSQSGVIEYETTAFSPSGERMLGRISYPVERD